jgi:hypothetical protein
MDQTVAFGSREYTICVLILTFGRGMDFLSTWLATPNLVLEANPLAKRLGWRWGALLNLGVIVGFGLWPLPAVIIATTSLLVAARNFQQTWLMRAMGEAEYQRWMSERLSGSSRTVFFLCLAAQTLLHAGLGGALVWFGGYNVITYGIGAGLIAYGVAVASFTVLAVRKAWRWRAATG